MRQKKNNRIIKKELTARTRDIYSNKWHPPRYLCAIFISVFQNRKPNVIHSTSIFACLLHSCFVFIHSWLARCVRKQVRREKQTRTMRRVGTLRYLPGLFDDCRSFTKTGRQLLDVYDEVLLVILSKFGTRVPDIEQFHVHT